MRTNNQNGSILVSVLVVLFILLTIFVSALTYVISRYSEHIKFKNQVVASNLAEAGVQRALSKSDFAGQPDIKQEWSSPNGGTITIETNAWGPFRLIFSEGEFGNQRITSTALIGSTPTSLLQAAVTVCDKNYPFVVAGNTLIYGDVNTGPLGMTEGRIKGETVAREDYHRGTLHIHDRLSHPIIDTAVMLEYIRESDQRIANPTVVLSGSRVFDRFDDPTSLSGKATIIENNLTLKDYSFTDWSTVSTISVGGRVNISGNSKISGSLEIIAGGPICVEDSATVDGAILISSDSIIISDVATFSGIAISETRISVRDHSSLSYPAFLCVRGTQNDCKGKCGIYISSKGTLESSCYLLVDQSSPTYNNYLLHIDTGTTFKGFLLSTGRAEVNGVVLGSILTDRFHYYLPPTTYVNWVKDLQIYRAGLQHSPALPLMQNGKDSNHSRVIREERSLR